MKVISQILQVYQPWQGRVYIGVVISNNPNDPIELLTSRSVPSPHPGHDTRAQHYPRSSDTRLNYDIDLLLQAVCIVVSPLSPYTIAIPCSKASKRERAYPESWTGDNL